MSINLPITKMAIMICPNCASEFEKELIIDEIEFSGEYERGMGTEVQYDFSSEIKCPYCNNPFEVIGEIWEYPEGAINHIEVK